MFKNGLGRRHLLLAHDVVQYPEDYYSLFGERPNYWPMSSVDHIIMDNSNFELKMPKVNSEMVWEAVKIVRPSCVVLPDIWLNGPSTVAAIKEVLESWNDQRFLLNFAAQLMALPQGNTFEEWVACAEALAKIPSIEWWGIPRNFRDHLGKSRMIAVKLCKQLEPSRKIHLFGFSHDYVDDVITCALPEVSSIDSTTPLRAGSLGINFSLTSMKLPARGDWWDNAKWNPKILSNLDYCRSIF